MNNFFLLLLGLTMWTSAVTILIHLLRKTGKDVKWFGLSGILAIYLLCFLRSLQPADFNLSHTYYHMPAFFNPFYETVVLNDHHLLSFTFKLKHLFFAVWIAVAAVRIVFLLSQYQKVYRYTSRCPVCTDAQLLAVLQEAKLYCKTDVTVTVRRWDLHSVPTASGLRNKTILLPYKDYNSQELFYIFVHELTHIRRHDLLVQLLQIWIRFFWWNPLFCLFYHDFLELAELKCDASATAKMTNCQKADYLDTILSVIQNTAPAVPFMRAPTVSLTGTNHDKCILERFQAIAKGTALSKRQKLLRTFIVVLTALSCLLSYCIIPGPGADAPMEDILSGGAAPLDPDTLFIVQRKDGYYLLSDGRLTDHTINDKLINELLDNGYQIVKKTYERK